MSSTVARRLASILLFVAAAHLAALEVPPKPAQWVNDYGANLLTPFESRQLNDKIEQLHRRTGVQFLVMIWPSLQGDDPGELTDRVAKMWKVEDDRALMLFVFVNDRKTFIKVGHGLEPVITNAYASEVYRNTLVPSFRRRQFYVGIDTAIGELTAKLEPASAPPVARPPASPPVRPPLPVRSTSAFPDAEVVIVGLVFIGLFAFVVMIIAISRRPGGGASSPRPGVGGGDPMFYGTLMDGTLMDMTGVTHTSSGLFSGQDAGGQDAGGSSVGGSWGGGDSSFNGGGAGGSW